MRFQNGRFTSRIFAEKESSLGRLNSYIGTKFDDFKFTAVERAQWLEYETLLAGYLLSTQGDRMCAANGVENRCPFLDESVVRTAKKYNLKYDDGTDEKMLLREAFRQYLPESIVNKRKFPYRAPDSKALLNHECDGLELVLSGAGIDKLSFLDDVFCKSLANKLYRMRLGPISPKEDQAFVFLYSLILLNEQFCAVGSRNSKFNPHHTPLNLVREIDRRSATIERTQEYGT